MSETDKIPQEELIIYYTVKCSNCGNTDPEMVFSFLKREDKKNDDCCVKCHEMVPYCAKCDENAIECNGMMNHDD